MIIFGTSCLGNLYRVIPMEMKVAIAEEWFGAYRALFELKARGEVKGVGVGSKDGGAMGFTWEENVDK